jgi:hypothetical protein
MKLIRSELQSRNYLRNITFLNILEILITWEIYFSLVSINVLSHRYVGSVHNVSHALSHAFTCQHAARVSSIAITSL